MKPTTRALVGRDPALAAALGILGAVGSNFGGEAQRPAFGGAGWRQPGMSFGFGADAAPGSAGAAALASPAVQAHLSNPMHPANAGATQAILAQHYAGQANTDSRKALITPNAGSTVQVERYDFSLTQALVMGTAAAIAMTVQPTVTLKPSRCTFNAPQLGWATISNILVGNVSGMAGQTTDAGVYGPTSVGIHLDLPAINPSNRLSITGNYLGLVSPGYPAAYPYPFVASFQCFATIVPDPSFQV